MKVYVAINTMAEPKECIISIGFDKEKVKKEADTIHDISVYGIDYIIVEEDITE